MQDEPAETAEEEIQRLTNFLQMKSREVMDEDASDTYPRPSKSRSLTRLATVLEDEKLGQYRGRTDTEDVLEELVEWCDSKIKAVQPEYELEEMSCFVELSKEIRRRLINYREGLMDVTLKVRQDWEQKYGE